MNEHQEIYDEERQVQIVHANSNAVEGWVHSIKYTHNLAKSPRVQVNNWADPLRLKNEENQRKMKMIT